MSTTQPSEMEEKPVLGGSDGPLELPTQAPKDVTKSYPTNAIEPTRYGDWERAGRCIDF